MHPCHFINKKTLIALCTAFSVISVHAQLLPLNESNHQNAKSLVKLLKYRTISSELLGYDNTNNYTELKLDFSSDGWHGTCEFKQRHVELFSDIKDEHVLDDHTMTVLNNYLSERNELIENSKFEFLFEDNENNKLFNHLFLTFITEVRTKNERKILLELGNINDLNLRKLKSYRTFYQSKDQNINDYSSMLYYGQILNKSIIFKHYPNAFTLKLPTFPLPSFENLSFNTNSPSNKRKNDIEHDNNSQNTPKKVFHTLHENNNLEKALYHHHDVNHTAQIEQIPLIDPEFQQYFRYDLFEENNNLPRKNPKRNLFQNFQNDEESDSSDDSQTMFRLNKKK